MARADEAAGPPSAKGRFALLGALLWHAAQVSTDSTHDEVFGIDRAMTRIDVRRIDRLAVVKATFFHAV
jgi:hypothetical protein